MIARSVCYQRKFITYLYTMFSFLARLHCDHLELLSR